jgi:hypothetical protein
MGYDAIEVLKRVFSYGDATTTHLNILDYLNEKGIPIEEYKTWGTKNACKAIVDC